MMYFVFSFSTPRFSRKAFRKLINRPSYMKQGDVLVRHELSLQVICKKVIFLNVVLNELRDNK